MNKQTNKNLNLILLRKSNTLKSLSQNIVFNMIRLFVRPQLFGRNARYHGLFLKIAMVFTCSGGFKQAFFPAS